MKIEKEVTITLTPAEVGEIIKNYLSLKHGEMKLERVHFDTKTDYSGYDDRSGGTVVISEIRVTGTLK